MRLNEIAGDTADIILDKLNNIYSKIRLFANTLNPSQELIDAANYYLSLLDEDRQNLNYWCLKDKRINSIYSKIQSLRK